MAFKFIPLLSFLLIFPINECSLKKDSDPLTFDSILPSNYDPSVPPKIKDNPVKVEVSVSVLNIRSIKETELTYVVDIFYHQYWSDYRLQSQNLNKSQVDSQRIVLDNSWKNKLWIPDTYFKNALSGHVPNIIFPTLYFVISNRTNVFMASRVSLQLSCEMEFSKFPHDYQECYIDIMSLSHFTESVLLFWKEFNLTKRLHMTQFYVSEYSRLNFTKSYPIGKFSTLRGRIRLNRELGLYVLKIYIPSTLIVIMSFVGFWIPITAYPARVALVITALLALITQQYQSSQVNVSYVIALNVWMIVCISFVFLGLIEYAIAISCNDKGCDSNITEENSKQKNIFRCFRIIDELFSFSKQNKVDTTSRYLFPIGFTICVALYLYVYAL